MMKFLIIIISFISISLSLCAQEANNISVNKESDINTKNSNIIILSPVNVVPITNATILSEKKIIVNGIEKKNTKNIVIVAPVNAIPANEYTPSVEKKIHTEKKETETKNIIVVPAINISRYDDNAQ